MSTESLAVMYRCSEHYRTGHKWILGAFGVMSIRRPVQTPHAILQRDTVGRMKGVKSCIC